jgi:hypothetical protein
VDPFTLRPCAPQVKAPNRVSVLGSLEDSEYSGKFLLEAPGASGGAGATLDLRGLLIRGAITKNNGGAIENFGGTLTIDGCRVSGCAATGFGAVTWGDPGSVLHLLGSEFVDNHATQAGGVVTSLCGLVEVRNSRFVGNSAKYGGVIFLDSLPSTVPHRAQFCFCRIPLAASPEPWISF